ncbi:MAG: C40 family peptidase [Bacteroides sp.]|nr:C40 family peptidase [Bacteroides sp.]
MQRIIFYLTGFILFFSCNGSVNKIADPLLATVESISEEIRQQYIPDKRVGIYDVTYTLSGKELTVKGNTTSPEAKQLLMDRISEKEYQVRDSLTLLPDEIALDGKIYGVVRLSVCNIRSAPDFSSEMVTQAVLGMPVRILQKQNWYQIQTPDNYIGWVHNAAIAPMNKQEYNQWNQTEKVIVTSHYGFTHELFNEKAQTVSDVVAGNRFKYLGDARGYYQIMYPDGRIAYISEKIAQREKEWRTSLKQDAMSIIQTAKSLLGVPYLWAGTSSKGMDCSGFVRNVLYMHDIIMPRDASQQAYVGLHIDMAADYSNLEPGDLIFFGRKATAERKERVVHVGIYIGNQKFIHAQGDIRISSFHPADQLYDEFNLNRLLFATRILPSINRIPEINTTQTNPYYIP